MDQAGRAYTRVHDHKLEERRAKDQLRRMREQVEVCVVQKYR